LAKKTMFLPATLPYPSG